MKILSDLVYNLKTGNFIAMLEEYDGEFALAGGGSEVTNETVPTGPWAQQVPYIQGLFQEAANLYNQGAPQAWTGVNGQLTPGINPNIANTQSAVGGLAGGNIDQNQIIQQMLQQLAGQQNPGATLGSQLTPGVQSGIDTQLNAGDNAVSQLANPQTGNVQNAYNTVFNSGPAPTVSAGGTQGGTADISGALQQQLSGGGGQNPYLDALVSDAMRSQVNSFQNSVLPGIRSEAAQAGQIGGSRQGIAEGIAAQGLNEQIAGTTANIYGNAFGQQAQLQGQAVQGAMNAQQNDQSAQLTAAGMNNQALQQYIQQLLQGTQQVGGLTQAGTSIGLDAVGSGTAQAGNLISQGNQTQLQQVLGSLGLIPNYQAGSVAQLGAVNQLGLQQYGLDQAALDALQQQYEFNQNSPFNLLSQYQQFITGPYGSTVNPSSRPNYGPTPITNTGSTNPQPATPQTPGYMFPQGNQGTPTQGAINPYMGILPRNTTQPQPGVA